MNKTRFLKFAVTALVLLNIGSTAFFLMRKPPPNGPKKIIIDRLHFDANQVADYEKLIKKHRTEIIQKDAELSAARQAIYQQLLMEDFSKKDSLIAQVGQLQEAVEQIHFAHFLELKNLCRADQQADFGALVSDLARYFPGQKRQKKLDNQ